MTHTISIKITPLCTACGKELQTAGLEAKSTFMRFSDSVPFDQMFVAPKDLYTNYWRA